MTADQAELRDPQAASFRARTTTPDAAIAESGIQSVIVQGIIASNRRALGIDHEHSGNGQSGSNGGINGHAERAQTTSPEAPSDSYHMREFGTFGIQNNALRRTNEGWPESG